MIAFSHKVRPVSGVYAVQKASKPSTRISRLRLSSGSANQRSGQLSHLVWRPNPQQCQARCEDSGNPLNKHEPGLGQLSIILDNEA